MLTLDGGALAAPVVTLGHVADVVIADGDTMGHSDSFEDRVGTRQENRSPARAYSGIFVFQLPALPAGHDGTVGSAHFSFLEFGTFGSIGLDLYGLPFRDAPTVDVAKHDFFSAARMAGEVPIQSDLMGTAVTSPSDALVFISDTEFATTRWVGTNGSGDAALAQYLTAQYAAGGAGRYVSIRLNPTTATGLADADAGYNILFSGVTTDGGYWAADEERPRLSMTFVPEPSAALVAAASAAAFLSVRRRRARR